MGNRQVQPTRKASQNIIKGESARGGVRGLKERRKEDPIYITGSPAEKEGNCQSPAKEGGGATKQNDSGIGSKRGTTTPIVEEFQLTIKRGGIKRKKGGAFHS